MPSTFIIQMPRFGKQYKLYQQVLPSPLLDVTDLIEGCKWNYSFLELEFHDYSIFKQNKTPKTYIDKLKTLNERHELKFTQYFDLQCLGNAPCVGRWRAGSATCARRPEAACWRPAPSAHSVSESYTTRARNIRYLSRLQRVRGAFCAQCLVFTRVNRAQYFTYLSISLNFAHPNNIVP